MKKIILAMTTAFILFGQTSFAGPIYSDDQKRFDYTGTSSGYPIYVGFAKKGVAASADAWRVCKATDTAAGPTLVQCTGGIWDNRASLSYS